MIRTIRTGILLLGMLVLLSTGAIAQEPITLEAVRFDRLVELVLMTQEGVELGVIQNAVIRSDGSIPYLVIRLSEASLDSDLGFERFLIPPQAISLSAEAERLIVRNLNLEELREYPGLEADFFESSDWSSSEEWDQEHARWWENEFGYEPEAGIDEASGFGSFEGDRNSILADELEEFEFVNEEGEDLGSVHGIMLDLQSRRVSYLALSAGGFLGIGSKAIAVPLNRVTVNADEEALVISATEEEIENAEGFEGGRWPVSAETTLFEQ